MAQGAKFSVDCGKNSNHVQRVQNRIIEISGLSPCTRQDGGCPPETFAVASGSRFIQFFNVPADCMDILKSAAEQAKEEILANVR